MLFGLAVVLVIAWILGFAVFKVAGWAIHLLIIFAVISFLAQLFSGRRKSV